MSTPLAALRQEMAAHSIHAVIIPTADYHGSEYVGAHFACRAYVSGFHGSAGTLLVLPDWAGLWTDGRYFLQAERELKGSGITLMRQGLAETPTLETALLERLQEGDTLAFDGRCISMQLGKQWERTLAPLKLNWRRDLDLVDMIWFDRPPLSAKPAWLLEACYAGESRSAKLTRLREAMRKKDVDAFFLTALEDIGWLLNLRGADMACTLVVLAYLSLTQEDCLLFTQETAFSPQIIDSLGKDGIHLLPYDHFYDYAATASAGIRLLLDGRRANLHLRHNLHPSCQIIDRPSPIEGFKAVKNATEVENMRLAHCKDGVALTKFLYWLKHTAPVQAISELDAQAQLEAFRSEQEHYLGPSFSPIVASGPHGAIVHYSATEETNAKLDKESFLLVDSGGHYLEGSTDCTRTITLGTPSNEQRQHYTTVLRGHLALMGAQFLHGCTGSNLDYLARAPLWEQKLDYRHGTGHGVGYLLNVHEGPNQIRWQANGAAVLEAGMITSNEPGLYLEGQYGIRLENLLLCVPRGESDFGSFLGFEALTLAPFDRSAIDASLLSPAERSALDAYHRQVYTAITPHLTQQEAAWLAEETAAIGGSIV